VSCVSHRTEFVARRGAWSCSRGSSICGGRNERAWPSYEPHVMKLVTDGTVRFQNLARIDSESVHIGETPEFNSLLWSTETVRIGSFHAPVDHPRFRDSGPIPEHTVVFPRSSVTIRHSGGQPFAPDSTRTVLYNRGQEYTRDVLDGRGDSCDWFAFPTSLIVEALEGHGARPGDGSGRLFWDSCLPCDRSTYFTQRLIVQQLQDSTTPDSLLVEEAALQVLRRATRPAGADPSGIDGKQRTHRDLAEAARAVLACRFRESMRLSQLAEELGCSVYHLCRVFRREIGRTLHQHRSELRLRAALQILHERRGRLTEVAHDLGFSSHAHLTDSFRSAFGLPPSAYLRRLDQGCRTSLSRSDRRF